MEIIRYIGHRNLLGIVFWDLPSVIIHYIWCPSINIHFFAKDTKYDETTILTYRIRAKLEFIIYLEKIC